MVYGARSGGKEGISADCFTYRNKIGLGVALEALKGCREQNQCGGDDVWGYAKVCRVANVMRPYWEAMASG